MAWNLSSPVTGQAIGALVTPTFTFAPGNVANQLSKAFIVTVLGGTQAGVETHSVGNPFIAMAMVPATFKVQGLSSNGVGTVTNGYNVFKTQITKGVVVDAAGNRRVCIHREETLVPPGADVYDLESIASMFSCRKGIIDQTNGGWYDTLRQGNL